MEHWGKDIVTKHKPEEYNIHILQSNRADVFSLGGDLELFVRCALTQDRETLAAYALSAVNRVYEHASGWNGRYDTIALIDGLCLGGGLEAALGARYIVVAEGATLQCPEAKFGLWPGMGAERLLRVRNVDTDIIDRIIHQGEVIDLSTLHAAGVIDRIVSSEKMTNYRNTALSYLKDDCQEWLSSARPITNPLLEHLQDDTLAWVDAALQLSVTNLKLMSAIVRRQQRAGL
jgi:DSF synthase